MFPSGWYAVATSDELAADQVRMLTYFGHGLVVSRDEDGDVQAHHARPYLDLVRSRPVLERNGLILVYFDPEGRPPAWSVPEIPELFSDAWVPLEKLERRARFRCEELRENGVDSAHLDSVHGFVDSHTELHADGPVLYQTTWMRAKLTAAPLAGTLEGVLRVAHHGPGCSIAWREIGQLQLLVLEHMTPIDEEHTHVRFDTFMRRLTAEEAMESLLEILGASSGQDMPHLSAETASQVLLPIVAGELGRRLEQEVWVTERTRHRLKPLSRSGMRAVDAMRRWARQFDSPATPMRLAATCGSA